MLEQGRPTTQHRPWHLAGGGRPLDAAAATYANCQGLRPGSEKQCGHGRVPVEGRTKDDTEELWSLSRVVEDLPDSWAEPHLAARAAGEGRWHHQQHSSRPLLGGSALYSI